MSALGRLRVLELDIAAAMAPRNVRDAGLACPLLRELALPGAVCDLDWLSPQSPQGGWGDDGPLFAHLERPEV